MNIKYWNSFASDFEDSVFEVANHDLRGVINKQIERVAKKGTVAADLGCGPGSLLPYICSKFEKVYAVDYADELLSVAKKNNDYKNVEYFCHDLVSKKHLPFTADVVFSVNSLISADYKSRQAMAQSLWRTTTKNGFSIVVVPSLESITHVYQTLVRCNLREGMVHHKAISNITQVYKKEVLSPIEGIVSIGGTPTKCFTREEITVLLSEIGFRIEEVLRVEFPWEEEIEGAPSWLKEPFPWDWLIICRKL
jgi:SAM-dependent methyltransferase